MLYLESAHIIDPCIGVYYAVSSSIKQTTGIHTHDFYEFFLITEGTVIHAVNETRELLAQGAFVFIRPTDVHYYEKQGTEECQLINLAFTKETIEALFSYAGEGLYSDDLLRSSLPPKVELSRMESQVLQFKMEKIITQSNLSKLEMKTKFRMLLAEIFISYFSDLDRAPYADGPTDVPDWLAKLYREMNKKENFVTGLPKLYELADKTPEYLCRVTKMYYRKTPTDMINNLRLHYAATLLTCSDWDILTISLECGFSNLSHFYHLFKQNYKMTPMKYRKLHRKTMIPE